MKKLQRAKGFTLMEMLIVVAIIALLVAIAIPTLIHSLEKSRWATDNANVRGALEKLIAQRFMSEEEDASNYVVHVGIMQADWDGTTTFGNLQLSDNGWTKGQDVYLCWEGDLDGHAYIRPKPDPTGSLTDK